MRQLKVAKCSSGSLASFRAPRPMSAITPLATAKADMVRASTAMQRTASAHGVRPAPSPQSLLGAHGRPARWPSRSLGPKSTTRPTGDARGALDVRAPARCGSARAGVRRWSPFPVLDRTFPVFSPRIPCLISQGKLQKAPECRDI